jgi:hypothetical protein
LQLRVVLANHPEATHYWCGEEFFSAVQILDGKCRGVRLDMPVETRRDPGGRLLINELGRGRGRSRWVTGVAMSYGRTERRVRSVLTWDWGATSARPKSRMSSTGAPMAAAVAGRDYLQQEDLAQRL